MILNGFSLIPGLAHDDVAISADARWLMIAAAGTRCHILGHDHIALAWHVRRLWTFTAQALACVACMRAYNDAITADAGRFCNDVAA